MPRPDLRTIRNVELVRCGTWQASRTWTATPQHIAAAVRAHEQKVIRRPPLRLGHDDGRPGFSPGDGEPALGYVDNLRAGANGAVLIGDFVGVPAWLANIAASAYPDRSVECLLNFKAATGDRYDMVLTGCALLGVTAPAIKSIRSLADVRRLYDGGAVAASGADAHIALFVTASRPRPPATPRSRTPKQAAALGVAASRRRARRAASVLDHLNGGK